MHYLRIVAVALICLGLAGCGGIDVPQDKADYIGEWKAVGTTLVITAGGGVSWKRIGKYGKVSFEGPLQAFKGDDFIAGALFLKQTFKVSKPPFQQDGQWKMVVEGIELTRVRR